MGQLRQIKERQYPQVLENYGSDLLLVGINYDEKNKKHECGIELIPSNVVLQKRTAYLI